MNFQKTNMDKKTYGLQKITYEKHMKSETKDMRVLHKRARVRIPPQASNSLPHSSFLL